MEIKIGTKFRDENVSFTVVGRAPEGENKWLVRTTVFGSMFIPRKRRSIPHPIPAPITMTEEKIQEIVERDIGNRAASDISLVGYYNKLPSQMVAKRRELYHRKQSF